MFQKHGTTDDQVLNVCTFYEKYSRNLAAQYPPLLHIGSVQLQWKNYKSILHSKMRYSMKLDYIVSRIEASQDGGAYVYVTYANPNAFKAGAERTPPTPFGANMMAFTSPEDLMKNLPKAMANIGKAMGGGGFTTDSPTFKISMREYEDMSIKVGDRVTIEIKKSDSSGI
jgi:hypothetical protein